MNKLKKSLKLKIKIPLNKEIKTEKIIDNKNSINEITDNIYISGYLIANDPNYLIQNNFTHVINCSYGTSMVNYTQVLSPKINYLSLYLRDDPSSDIIHNILEAIDFIEKDELYQSKKILFHCVEGISRGPAVAAGYLMWKKNMKKNEAIELISSKRKNVDINLGFSVQLNKWENYLMSLPDQLNIFKINHKEKKNSNIKLLDEDEFKQENIYDNDNEYLFRYKGKFFHLKFNSNNKEEEMKVEENVDDEIFRFIRNIQKYDKSENNEKENISNIEENVMINKLNIKNKGKFNDYVTFFKDQIMQY